MTHCPTCRARRTDSDTCYRCGTSHADVIAVENESAHCVEAARDALARRDLPRAQGYIDRALDLHRSSAALGTAALVALAIRDYPSACSLWWESRAAGEAPTAAD